MMLYMLVDSPDSQICGFIGLSPYSVQRSVAHFIVTTTSSRSAFRFVRAIRKVSWFRHRLYIEYVPTQSLGFATPRSVWPIIFITCAHCTLRETVIHFVHCHIQYQPIQCLLALGVSSKPFRPVVKDLGEHIDLSCHRICLAGSYPHLTLS